MMKSDVNGANMNSIYKWLRSTSPKDADIKWNFATGFLVDPAGSKVVRFDKMPKSWDNLKTQIFSNRIL